MKSILLDPFRSDEALRRLVYKLVPDLYQQERERVLRFTSRLQPSRENLPNRTDLPSEQSAGSELEEEYFSPTEPIR